jgi:arylsulfatase A-like enzyme
MPERSDKVKQRCLLVILLCLTLPGGVLAADRPNIVVILTDDQGIGDLSLHDNPILKTPNLDRIATTGVRFSRFYVAPVCSPTRSSLLTGRYYYRTGIVDTFQGRSMMHADEVTLADTLAAAGYRTGLFGKWHLGDCYPLRPQDHKFGEVLMHRGGGIGQPSDPPGGGSYFDPHLEHNGKPVQRKGYISDILTDAALEFMDQPAKEPFLVWLAFNAPHTPLEVPAKYLDLFKDLDLGPDKFPKLGQPWKPPADFTTARIYGMVKNIDDNVGRLLTHLEERKLRDNTIVVFLSDNGPQQERYKMGLRGLKGTVFEAGIRVPFCISWPGRLKAGRTVSTPAAHIDLLPTLLDLCGVVREKGPALDGRSLVPLLDDPDARWAPRTLFTQWHRGDTPQMGRAFAAIGPRWKLAQPMGVAEGSPLTNPPLLLFDLVEDPYEQHDRAKEHPDTVAELKKAYEAWFEDVKKSREFQPPRIVIGAPQELVTTLTRQDWRGAGPGRPGHWNVEIARGGTYRVRLWFPAVKAETQITFELGKTLVKQTVALGTKETTLTGVKLEAGPGQLQVTLEIGMDRTGPTHVELTRE